MSEEELKQTVLVVDDHESVRKQLYWALEDGYRVLEAGSRTEALSLLDKEQVDVVLCDLRLPPVESDISEGLAILESIRKLNPLLPVIVITGDEDRETALKVVQRGAYDLFHKPFNVEEVEIIVRRATQHYLLEKDNLNLRDELRRSGGFQGGIVGSSPVLRRIIDQARAVAETTATVLITGESGTGKEMLARFIHNISPRARAPFVACNIAALPESLVESELFGHEKGAFTGATARRLGRFEMANTGTLFLDEIGELSPAMQVKLLRVLQEREVQRVGGERPVPVDVRLMAASNRDIQSQAAAGEFRRDLYYRLSVVTLRIPPLRDRREDIPMLVDSYINYFRTQMAHQATRVSPEALQALVEYDWAGNVRELINVMERALLLCPHETIGMADLPAEFSTRARTVKHSDPIQELLGSEWGRQPLGELLEAVEQAYLVRLLRETCGRVGRTATLAGIDPRVLYEKMRRHGLEKHAFRDSP